MIEYGTINKKDDGKVSVNFDISKTLYWHLLKTKIAETIFKQSFNVFHKSNRKPSLIEPDGRKAYKKNFYKVLQQ